MTRDASGVPQFAFRHSPFEMVMSQFAIRNSHEYVTVPGSPNSQFAIRDSYERVRHSESKPWEAVPHWGTRAVHRAARPSDQRDVRALPRHATDGGRWEPEGQPPNGR